MSQHDSYEPLTPLTLGGRLSGIKAIAHRLGSDSSAWWVKEVGDGNLNLVFIVGSTQGEVIVKQALPYVRLVGDSWPLPLKRAFFEHAALTRQAKRDPGMVPEILHFDEEQALIVMEFLTPHVILRKKLIAGERVEELAQSLGHFCARTAFYGSDLAMDTAEKKADVALFAGNVELTAITESLVFTDPYYAAEMNHHTDGLDPVVKKLRDDKNLKLAVQDAFFAFSANAETLCHGDLHTGSIMCTETDTRIIDPEFGFYGPMGFDLGMLIANFMMAFFSQPAHRNEQDLDTYQDWILKTVEEICSTFRMEFDALWRQERRGILYPSCLFEDQGQSLEGAPDVLHARIWQDALRFCGIEMHRRTLSLAHNADFETIEDPTHRSPLEARNLMMGREVILQASHISDPMALTALAHNFNKETVL